MERTTRASALGLLLLGMTRTSYAHEHHMDDIPEGQGVSAEPLVGYFGLLEEIMLTYRMRYYGFTF